MVAAELFSHSVPIVIWRPMADAYVMVVSAERGTSIFVYLRLERERNEDSSWKTNPCWNIMKLLQQAYKPKKMSN